MNFRKATLYVRVSDSIQTRKGYTFKQCASWGEILTFGVYQMQDHGKKWVVSCMRTGRSICIGRTRALAVKMLHDTYLSKYERIMLDNKSIVHMNYFERESEIFSQMVEEYERGIA